MTKLTYYVTTFLNSAIIALLASVARALLKPSDTIKQTILTILGSILFGMLVGHLLEGVEPLKVWKDGIVAGVGLLSRELIELAQIIVKDPIAFWQKLRGHEGAHKSDDSEKGVKS
jgi:hypothetical protein